MEVAQQIHLDHPPIMADPPLTLKECFRTRLKMDDENYRNVLNWYKSCIKLGETKSGRQKDAYTMRLIQNLLRTSSEFFGQTRLTHETVTKIENECAKMVDIILYPSDLPKNEATTRRSCESTEKSVKTGNVDDKMTPLLKHIKWAAIAASILVLFIFFILLYFCVALKSSQNSRKCDCPCEKCNYRGNGRVEAKMDKKQCSKSDKRKRRKYNKRGDFDDDYDDDEDVNVNLKQPEVSSNTSSTNVITVSLLQQNPKVCSRESIEYNQQPPTTTLHLSGRGKRKGDPAVDDIRGLYRSNRGMCFKLRHPHDYIILPQGRRLPREYPEPSTLYDGPLEVTRSKFNQLQELKPFTDRDYHPFYDCLKYKSD